ncbi:MAG TPA: hypothetical protein VFD92_01730 [Candidatus Binatia bacterium]|nr:hypothetical protein [Candidatus Binatia bacterium]
MTLFARCFLLVFCQLGVGGLLSLAVPPFHDLERGFYKSSAGVFFSASLVGALGTVDLLLTRDASGVSWLEAALWIAHLVLFGLYLSTLWGDAMVARARLYAAALLTGVAALAVGAGSLIAGHGILLETLSVLSALVSAVAVGSVTTGMLIGHWYLIDPGMEIEPFQRCFRFFVRALWAEIAMITAIVAALTFSPALPVAAGDHLALVALRVVLGPVAALAMAALIGRVLAIPQTMAATGLFYIATLAVLVGEFLGRYFTFRTGLPL